MKYAIGITSAVCVIAGGILIYNVTETVDSTVLYGSLIGCGLFLYAMTFFFLGFFVSRGIFYSAIDAANQSQNAGMSQVNALGRMVASVGKMRQHDAQAQVAPARPVFDSQEQPANNLMPLPFSASASRSLIVDGLPGDDEGMDDYDQ